MAVHSKGNWCIVLLSLDLCTGEEATASAVRVKITIVVSNLGWGRVVYVAVLSCVVLRVGGGVDPRAVPLPGNRTRISWSSGPYPSRHASRALTTPISFPTQFPHV